jgi:tetratricopeptide (TPR) repeat protein
MTNSRFEDLEKRVLNIKIKKYIKIFLLLAVFSALVVYSVNSNFLKEKTPKKPPHVDTIEVNNTAKKVEDKVEENLYDTINLSPTIIIPKIQVKAQDKKQNNVQEVKALKVTPPVVKKKVTVEKQINFKIKEVKSEEALLERFSLAGDYESSVGLAKLYFEKSKFEKAIYWSKKASKINAEAQESWIVYAKAKVALNQKEDAIKSLELYLNYFTSDDISQLLITYKGLKL